MTKKNAQYEITVLFPGHSVATDDTMAANCSCTLLKGPQTCIVDTRTAWDGKQILEALKKCDVSPDDINFVICTHGHSDHIGCNYLFQNAIHIVGFSISFKDKYYLSPNFSTGEEYIINDQIKVIPTPGHTLQDVTVILKRNETVYAMTGDLFENEQDLQNESIWINAGSDSVELQRKHRSHILSIADFIVPGHGPMFKIPKI